jgi:amino acid permease
MAIAGFLAFGDKTAGNLLNNFPADNIMVNIARLYDIRQSIDCKLLGPIHIPANSFVEPSAALG